MQTFELTYSFAAQSVAAHTVSAPDASAPAALVLPAAHAVQTFELTYSFAAQSVAAHSVSAPSFESPTRISTVGVTRNASSALVLPAAHATHALVVTDSSTAHEVAARPVCSHVSASAAGQHVVSVAGCAPRFSWHCASGTAAPSARHVITSGAVSSAAPQVLEHAAVPQVDVET